MELVKERFSKLLLGEDMSGGGKGVCTAVAISNAITNLYGKHLSKQGNGAKTRNISCTGLLACIFIDQYHSNMSLDRF
jgi:hypothetical protein